MMHQATEQEYETTARVFRTAVKVKLNLNTLSERSHKRSRVQEPLLEKLWKKEHG